MQRSATATALPRDSVATEPHTPQMAAVFNLDDPNEARVQRAVQTIYAPDSGDRLVAIRRGTANGVRMAWTLGSARAQRPRDPDAWAVLHFTVDEISIRIERCPDEARARAAFNNAEHASPHLPGIRVARK